MEILGYTESGSIRVEIDGVETFVPDDIANRHRQIIAEWEAFGNTIPPAPPKPPAPLAPLTARQLRLGLVANGISLMQVEAEISSIDDESAKVEWEYASQFERSHPLIEQVGAKLDLTPEQIDEMWKEALSL